MHVRIVSVPLNEGRNKMSWIAAHMVIRQTKENEEEERIRRNKKWSEDLLAENDIKVGTDEEFAEDLEEYYVRPDDMFDEDDFDAWRDDESEW